MEQGFWGRKVVLLQVAVDSSAWTPKVRNTGRDADSCASHNNDVLEGTILKTFNQARVVLCLSLLGDLNLSKLADKLVYLLLDFFFDFFFAFFSCFIAGSSIFILFLKIFLKLRIFNLFEHLRLTNVFRELLLIEVASLVAERVLYVRVTRVAPVGEVAETKCDWMSMFRVFSLMCDHVLVHVATAGDSAAAGFQTDPILALVVTGEALVKDISAL